MPAWRPCSFCWRCSIPPPGHSPAHGHLGPLAILIGLELLRYVVDFVRFGREASYHLWSAKLWGVILFLGFFALLVFAAEGLWVSLVIYWGILSDLEGLAISLVLREWRTDVPTLAHALRLRRGVSRAAPQSH